MALLTVLEVALLKKNPEKFDWLTLVSGMGHLHMNQMKTFFKVCDQVFMEPLGKEVFESKKVYDYFINAKDTHKSFQAITVLLFGATAELCYKLKQEVNVTSILETSII